MGFVVEGVVSMHGARDSYSSLSCKALSLSLTVYSFPYTIASREVLPSACITHLLVSIGLRIFFHLHVKSYSLPQQSSACIVNTIPYYTQTDHEQAHRSTKHATTYKTKDSLNETNFFFA
jgi:hypothetical protein